MNLEMRGIHYHISDTSKEFIEKKLKRIDFAKDYIVDLSIIITKGPHEYEAEGKAHFKWGTQVLVKENGYELYEAIELLMDKLEHTIRKEKGKRVEHRGKPKKELHEEMEKEMEEESL